MTGVQTCALPIYDGTARSTDAVNTIGTYFGGLSAFRATTNGSRTGSGGSVNLNNTSFGYYNCTTSATGIFSVLTSSSTYSGDYFKLYVAANGAQGSNGDVGSAITFYLNYYSAHTSTTSALYGSSGDTLNVTVNHRVDIVYPESTNLTSTWGTPTVS